MALALSQSEIQDAELRVTLDVFYKILEYAYPNAISENHISTLYKTCFSKLRKPDFINEEIARLDHKSSYRPLQKDDTIYPLFIIFLYFSRTLSKETRVLMGPCIVKIEYYAFHFVRDKGKHHDFLAFAASFSHEQDEPLLNTLGISLSDIKTEFEKLSKGFSAKLEELCARATKASEDKIKNLEAVNKTLYDKNCQLEAENDKLTSNVRDLCHMTSTLQSQVAKLQSEPKKKKDKELDITGAYCEIAVRYMNANRNKSQSAREKKKDVLNDILNQLKLNPSEEIRKRINDFDDVQRPPRLKLEINGDVKTLSVDGDLNVEKGDVNIDQYNEK